MSAERPSDLFKNKTNVHPVINRSTQATAEDFVEAGLILDNHADILNALLNTSGADFYGIFATLAALQAAYPIGGVINEGSYAIITLGVGNPIEIAVFTDPEGWQIVDQTSQVLLYTNRNAFPTTGQEGIWYIDKAANRAYLWYNAAYNLPGGNSVLPAKPFKKNFLPLSGVALNQDLLSIIADAILYHAPWTCAAGQKMEFFTANVATDAAGAVFEIRHYVLNRFITEIGAGADISLTGDDIIPLGKITNEVPDEENSSLVAALGNIGTTDLEDAFNEGKLIGAGPAKGPWEVGTIFFVTATQTIEGDDVLKRYIFRGDPGLYGGDDLGTDPDILEATAQMFQDITEEPQLPSAENNIITLKTVLDTDLATVDAAGLATYYNELDPGVLKQGYESWRIVVVDDEDVILKTFDLVNRGKGPIGVEAITYDPTNALTAEMFFEINKLTPPVINVKTFGATGDGITDDTEAIEDAFLEAKTGAKKNVYFPEGIYLISRTLYISSDITYFGAGKKNSIIRAATTATFDTIATVENNITNEYFYIPMIATEGASWDIPVTSENIVIRDLGIDWNSVEVGNYSSTPLLFGKVKNSKINNCYFYEALPANLDNTSSRNHGSSILLAFAEDNVISENIFLAVDYENISHNYLSFGNKIEKNYFYIDKPNTYGYQAHAIQTASVNSVLLESQFGTSRTQDVFVEKNTIVMKNNIANGITSHGSDGLNAKDNLIVIDGVTPVAIKPFDGSFNYNIDNNVIRAKNVNGFETYGNGEFGFMAISASNHAATLDPSRVGKITNNKIHIINDSIYAGSLPSYINPIIGSNALDNTDNVLITNNQIIIDGYDDYAKNIISVRGSYIGVIANTVELINPLEAVTEDGINFLEIENGENVIVDNNIVNGEVGNYITETGTNSDIKEGINSWNSLSGDKAIATKEYVDRKQIKTISDDTYILLETDNNKILNFTSATDVTITVPAGLTIGNRFEGKQKGAGQLIFVDDGTTVINIGVSETNKTLEQFSVWGLDCCDTDEYDLFGKLELA